MSFHLPGIPRVDRLAGHLGRSIYEAVTPRTAEPEGAGPDPNQGTLGYLHDVARSFDPRTKEGLLSYAGLLAGGKGVPRWEELPYRHHNIREYRQTPMPAKGWGFAEKSAPASVPGYTIERVSSRGGIWRDYTGAEAAHYKGYGRGRRRRDDIVYGGQGEGHTVPLIYNIVRDHDRNVVGSINMDIGTEGVHVHDLWIHPSLEKTSLAMDLIKIPYKAGTSDTMKEIGATIAEPTGKLGRIMSRAALRGDIKMSQHAVGQGITRDPQRLAELRNQKMRKTGVARRQDQVDDQFDQSAQDYVNSFWSQHDPNQQQLQWRNTESDLEYEAQMRQYDANNRAYHAYENLFAPYREKQVLRHMVEDARHQEAYDRLRHQQTRNYVEDHAYNQLTRHRLEHNLRELESLRNNTLDTGYNTAMRTSNRATPRQDEQLAELIHWLENAPP